MFVDTDFFGRLKSGDLTGLPLPGVGNDEWIFWVKSIIACWFFIYAYFGYMIYILQTSISMAIKIFRTGSYLVFYNKLI